MWQEHRGHDWCHDGDRRGPWGGRGPWAWAMAAGGPDVGGSAADPDVGWWGPSGQGPGAGLGGPRGFGRGARGGRRRGRGDVRAALLVLLAERPMHGYEMISQLEERTQGAWRPSPGSVYPTLQLLEDEGLVRVEADGGRRRYHLTSEGREAAVQVTEAGTPWARMADEPGSEARRDLRRAAFATMAAVRQVAFVGGAAEQQAAAELLGQTCQRLYRLLGGSEDERGTS